MRSPLAFILFLLAFYSVFTLLHWFFWRGLVASFALPQRIRWTILAFFALMYLFPVVNHLCTAFAGALPVRGFAWIGYLWFAFLFYYLFIGGLFAAGALAADHFLGESAPRRPLFVVASLLCLVVIVYGFFEAANLRVRRVTVTSPDLPEFVSTIRIVQVSDTHFTHLNGLRFAKKLTEIIKAERPDLIAHTGDFLDRGFVDDEQIAALWREIPAPLGKYAVAGNHEFYNGIAYTSAELEKAGFTLLRNRAEERAGAIVVAGVDDPTASRFGEPDPNPVAVLSAIPREKFVLFLRHQPERDDSTKGLFDLQLSGHTHNGQLWPFSLFVSLVYPMRGGVYRQDNGSTVIVSSGAGTWGPPIRVLAPPEIVVIEVIRRIR